jgi:hypothetical protein
MAVSRAPTATPEAAVRKCWATNSIRRLTRDRTSRQTNPFDLIKYCTSPVETTTNGQPIAIIWRARRYRVRVFRAWDTRVYRIAATLAGQAAIAEIALVEDGWRLRRWWT